MKQPVQTLTDQFDRSIRYLRLSVTDRCNLRCTYCMAEDMTFLPKSKVLSIEEMLLVARVFIQLGVEKIRLTGGEPLVRKGLLELARGIGSEPGLKQLVMTTNGVLLDQFAQDLRKAGMSRVNISLDTLDALRFKQMTRFGELSDVMRGIAAAKQAGFDRIKINAVILKGVNDHELLDLTRFAVNQELDISFIEEMPLGEIQSHDRPKTAISSEEIRKMLDAELGLKADSYNDPLGGPARYQQIASSNTRVGFISPMSHNFCGTCNRVRVTTEGRLLLCLGNEDSVDLRSILRSVEASPSSVGLMDTVEDRLAGAIIEGLRHKPAKHEFDPREIKIFRHMSATGG